MASGGGHMRAQDHAYLSREWLKTVANVSGGLRSNVCVLCASPPPAFVVLHVLVFAFERFICQFPPYQVIIANPETKGQCGDSHLGEIWVQSGHSASGYFTIYGDEHDYADHFSARLVTGNTGEVYARTGYLGFLRRTEGTVHTAAPEETILGARDSDTESLMSQQSITADSPELHDAVFVVGALDETIMLRGMRYHPIDIENSVLRCHKKIAEW